MGGLPVANSMARPFSAVSVFSLGLSFFEVAADLAATRPNGRAAGGTGTSAPDAHAAPCRTPRWPGRWDQVYLKDLGLLDE